MEVADLSNLFLEVGGHSVTGLAENAINIPSPDWLITSKEGLDRVAWLKKNLKSQELMPKVTLQADSPSVLILKGFEKTSAIVPFRFEWADIGCYVEALECVVQEVGGLDVGSEMPDVVFEFKLKNFVEIKGL